MRPLFLTFLLPLLMLGCVAVPDMVPPEKWQIDFGSEQWKIGSQERTRSIRIIEYVPADQTVDNWREIVTDEFIGTHLPTTTAAMNANLADLRRVVDGLQSAVIYDTGTEAVYEWWHPDSGKWPAEDQLSLIKYYPTGIMTLSYARKGPRMSDALRTKSLDRFKNAKLR